MAYFTGLATSIVLTSDASYNSRGTVPECPTHGLVARLRACDQVHTEHDRHDRCGGAQQPRKVSDQPDIGRFLQHHTPAWKPNQESPIQRTTGLPPPE